ncbi:MAG: chlorite dismutase family protein [Leptospirillum sp.]
MPEGGTPESEKSVVWTDDAQALLKKVPFFIRKNVEKEAEDYARQNASGKVDAGVIARIKSLKMERSDETQSDNGSPEGTAAPEEFPTTSPEAVAASLSGRSAGKEVHPKGTNATSARSDEGESALSESPLSKDFSSFSLFRLDPGWRKLHPTEIGHGKREFHEIVKSYSNQISVYSYCLVGLHGTGDLLLWRTGTSLEVLQEMTGKMLSTFFGRYLITEKNYMGYLTQQNNRSIFTPSKSRFIHVKPIIMTQEWHQLAPFIRSVIEREAREIAPRFSGIRLTSMASYGLDESDYVMVLESDSPEILVEFNSAFQSAQIYRYIADSQRGITAISRSMSDILDLLGG